jgi:nucleoid DNA-binding protein
MNKADLIKAVSNVTNTKKEASTAVNCILETITKALKKKETVTLIGFGTFAVRKRKARNGRNPQTGEKIKIKAKTVPIFRPGKVLKAMIK